MTRQITFRGKYSDKHGWVYGHYYNNCDCGVNQDIIVYHNIDEGTGTHSIINQKYLGQFTGLVDKNGKEIYEGDYLRDSFGEIFEVIFGNGRWIDKAVNGGSEMQLYRGNGGVAEYKEVVGNIYDTPELAAKKRGV